MYMYELSIELSTYDSMSSSETTGVKEEGDSRLSFTGLLQGRREECTCLHTCQYTHTCTLAHTHTHTHTHLNIGGDAELCLGDEISSTVASSERKEKTKSVHSASYKICET